MMDLEGKLVLDPCCSGRMFWFNRNHPAVVFGDIRRESIVLCDGREFDVDPDVLMDFSDMPFNDGSFRLVVFDPPHLNRAGNGWLSKKYGRLDGDWMSMLERGFSECFRVLMQGGVLVFKWNEVQVPVAQILKLAKVPPLFGHKSGKRSDTHWICFIKPE
ncbi:methyltransferase [Neisseria wadsworthii]|uniref:Phage methyltransferase n=1 Tax=Neisseria wadsworthii 9715 TaxID=1030841 RepID=G4CPK3_9NEIS|nr:methyltransferase [Neisseria wadsworthii]EGZ47766.1 phage methyltransferase [Neisseria wadsworthii 9715]